MGSPDALQNALVVAVGLAVLHIDMRSHRGQQPRMGAADVMPVFLYEGSATRPERRNPAHIRKGQFEGMVEKLKSPHWQPDFGPAEPNPSAWVIAVGARMPLIAYNVNLGTDDWAIADALVAKAVPPLSMVAPRSSMPRMEVMDDAGRTARHRFPRRGGLE